MKTINFILNSGDDLDELKPYAKEKNILVQIFCGVIDEIFAESVIKQITKILPHAKIILTSSYSGVITGDIHAKEVLVSVSIFRKTKVRTLAICKDDIPKMTEKAVSLVRKDTKLLLMFGNLLDIDTSELLSGIYEAYPNLVIAGGSASGNFPFDGTFIGTESGVCDNVFAIAFLDSKDLKVYNGCVSEWNGIGVDMVVTKSEGDVVYEINNIPAIDMYKKYIGGGNVENFLAASSKIPLIYKEGDIKLIRSTKKLNDDGSITYFGRIKEGTKVKFAVGSFTDTKSQTNEIVKNISDKSIEGVFVYSCIGRHMYYGKTIVGQNICTFSQVAPVIGFFSYGEFYHHQGVKNYLLNYTSTYVALSENVKKDKPILYEVNNNNVDEYGWFDGTVETLTNLITNINNEYNEVLNMTKQYQDALSMTSLLICIDENHIIVDVNDTFLMTSQYKKEQVLGKNVRDIFILDDTLAREIYTKMKNRETWRGDLRFIDNNVSVYFVKAMTIPLIDEHRGVTKYMICMNDINEQEYKARELEHSVKQINRELGKKDSMLKDYQTLLYKSAAVMKMKNGIFVDVSDSCTNIFGYERDEILGKGFEFLVKPGVSEEMIELSQKQLGESGYCETTGTCVDKNGDDVFVQAYMMVVGNSACKSGRDVIAILHDITEVKNSQKELEEIQKEVIFAMGSISEGRSRETGNHVKRVAKFSYLLAKLYGLSEVEADLLKIASPMHDIGKLAIPDSILHKPGKLTDDEFEIMKTHAGRGYEMLNFSNKEIIKTAAQIANTHHEWWNGNGYPNKISGYDIPIYGRITAVADVFDALGNDRCYKKAWPMEQVIEHMKKNSGVQFEPKLIDLLVENLDDFLAIKKEFEDNF